MKLKIVKPKPKFYRISYAMLKNVTQKKVQPAEVQKNNVTVKQTAKFADKYDKIVDEAVRKHLIDESDRETKLLELKSLSDEEFKQYEQQVNQEENINVDNIAEKEQEQDNMTEAEKALARIRKSGPIIGDFSDESNATVANTGFSSSENRSLADIKAQRQLDVNSFNEENLMDDALMHLEQKRKKKEQTANVKPMGNLKGLTKPIVHESSQFKNNISDIFSNLNWTMGSR